MSRRTSSLLAWSLWALSIALEALLRVLDFRNGHVASPLLAGTVPGIATATIGALIASRRPANPIGWLFLSTMLLEVYGGDGNFASQYAIFTLTTQPGALPDGRWVLWLGSITRILGFIPLVTFLLLLFPNGHLPSPRWRIIAWAVACYIPLILAVLAVDPAPMTAGPISVGNPLGVESARGLFATLVPALLLIGAGLVLASVSATLDRFRHAREDERQQLKWFAYGALLIPLIGLAGILGATLNVSWLANTATSQLSVAAIPIVTGIAILKHRLYDIDVLINRTLVYSVLTTTLALVYIGLVVVLQSLFRAVIGQQTDLAIVASTLAIAALFQPLRLRIQRLIDHRFYRRRYDAARVLASFGASVRDEVDLKHLTDTLVTVVDETMQPKNVWLWLRSESGSSGRATREGGKG